MTMLPFVPCPPIFVILRLRHAFTSVQCHNIFELVSLFLKCAHWNAWDLLIPHESAKVNAMFPSLCMHPQVSQIRSEVPIHNLTLTSVLWAHMPTQSKCWHRNDKNLFVRCVREMRACLIVYIMGVGHKFQFILFKMILPSDFVFFLLDLVFCVSACLWPITCLSTEPSLSTTLVLVVPEIYCGTSVSLLLRLYLCLLQVMGSVMFCLV